MPRQLVEGYWQFMNTNDYVAVGALLHDAFTLDWPQSGERIRGRGNFATVNANYPLPGPWRFTVERLLVDEREVATVVMVDAPEFHGPVVSFFEVRDGLIWRIQEYWPDPFAAAPDRAQWVERV
jgi:ketosteroid isomerase-like protein